MKEYYPFDITQKLIQGRLPKGLYKQDSSLPLFWGGTALEIKVKSQEVWAYVSCDYDCHEPWLCVMVNGYVVSRFIPPKKNPQWVCLVRNLSGENIISIVKDTQPIFGDKMHSVFIHKIGLSDEHEFFELPKRDFNIEFIGDSITSGEGLYGKPFENDWITTFMSSSKTYAYKVADKLNANYSFISQSGWGLCWGYDGNLNSNIPMHYSKVCSLLSGDYQKSLGTQLDYDFSTVKQDFIIINLMTNDEFAFKCETCWQDEKTGKVNELKLVKGKPCKENQEYILNATINFLKEVRKNNPYAKILWVYNMLKLDFMPSIVLKGIKLYKKQTNDKYVYSLKLPSLDKLEFEDEDKGSRFHPGPKTHKVAAEKIVSFINKHKSINKN